MRDLLTLIMPIFVRLISNFDHGRGDLAADLDTDYADYLPMIVIPALFSFPPDEAENGRYHPRNPKQNIRPIGRHP